MRENSNITIILPLYWLKLNKFTKYHLWHKLKYKFQFINFNDFRNYATIDKYWCSSSCQAQTPSSPYSFPPFSVCTSTFVPAWNLKMTVNTDQSVCRFSFKYKSNNSHLIREKRHMVWNRALTWRLSLLQCICRNPEAWFQRYF